MFATNVVFYFSLLILNSLHLVVRFQPSVSLEYTRLLQLVYEKRKLSQEEKKSGLNAFINNRIKISTISSCNKSKKSRKRVGFFFNIN